MNQLISTIIAFFFIPLLLRLKVRLSLTIAITASVLALFSGIGFQAVWRVLLGVFIEPSSRDTILTVLMVSIVGGSMKHYGLLDEVVTSVLHVIRSRKTVLMIIPSLIGTLTIPGGAVLSAPFVDNIGKDAGLEPPQRAAVNLIFRHIATMVFPFSMVMLFVRSAMPTINIYRIILYNLLFMLALLSTAYFLFLRKIETNEPIENQKPGAFGHHLRRLFFYTAPIYVPVLINALTGLPFFIAMLVSVGIIFVQCDRTHFPWVFRKSASWDTVLIIVSVLTMKDIILRMDDMLQVFDHIFARAGSHLSMMGIFILTSLFFGFITGNMTAPLAVTLPMLTRISLGTGMTSGHLHVFTYFLMISAFLGYYFSPLHLCQTFTLKVMKVTTGELYRAYGVYALAALCLLVLSTVSLLVLVT